MTIVILWALVDICLIALVIWLVIYVLTTIVEFPIPGKIIQVGWCIFLLLALIYLLSVAPIHGYVPFRR